MDKQLLFINVTSASALSTCLMTLEAGLAVIVLLTALYINVRTIIRRHKRK